MSQKRTFPERFLWGAATSSFQVEGGIENIDWAKAGHEGRVPEIGRACDHYHRYEEDFNIVKELGHTCHRFSIEWARIEPKEGIFDEREIEHYRLVLRALHKRGIVPFITLWHFSLPLWFSEKGGFERSDATAQRSPPARLQALTPGRRHYRLDLFLQPRRGVELQCQRMPDGALALRLEFLHGGFHAVRNQDANGGTIRHNFRCRQEDQSGARCQGCHDD